MSRADFFGGVGVMVFAASVYLITLDMPRAPIGIGPGDYPRFIVTGLFVLGGILAARSYVAGLKPMKGLYPPKALLYVAALTVITYIYIRLMPYLGFLYLTPIYLMAAFFLFGVKERFRALFISITCAGAIYGVFTSAFQVLLPKFSLF
jgi:hypothetical protein